MKKQARPAPSATPLDRRAEILQLLREADAALDLTEIAARVGVHRNTARFHLENLITAGQVERIAGTPAGAGRPPQLFQLASGWDPMGPRHYEALAGALLDHLHSHVDGSTAAEDAGYHWGLRLAGAAPHGPNPHGPDEALAQLTGGLAKLGFAPDSTPSGTHEINLWHCPFQELTAHPDRLVCQLHRGLVRGALEVWRSPARLVELAPEVEPGRCVIHLVVDTA